MPGLDSPFFEPERASLVKSISDEILGATKTNKNITFRTIWGCFWLSGIEKLRELAARTSEDIDGSAGMLELFEQRKIIEVLAIY